MDDLSGNDFLASFGEDRLYEILPRLTTVPPSLVLSPSLSTEAAKQQPQRGVGGEGRGKRESCFWQMSLSHWNSPSEIEPKSALRHRKRGRGRNSSIPEFRQGKTDRGPRMGGERGGRGHLQIGGGGRRDSILIHMCSLLCVRAIVRRGKMECSKNLPKKQIEFCVQTFFALTYKFGKG